MTGDVLKYSSRGPQNAMLCAFGRASPRVLKQIRRYTGTVTFTLNLKLTKVSDRFQIVKYSFVRTPCQMQHSTSL